MDENLSITTSTDKLSVEKADAGLALTVAEDTETAPTPAKPIQKADASPFAGQPPPVADKTESRSKEGNERSTVVERGRSTVPAGSPPKRPSSPTLPASPTSPTHAEFPSLPRTGSFNRSSSPSKSSSSPNTLAPPLQVALLHGMRLTGTQFAPVVATPHFRMVKAAGHNVLTPDIPGHGRNATVEYSVEATSRVVCEALEGLTWKDARWTAERERMGRELNAFRPSSGKQQDTINRRSRSSDGLLDKVKQGFSLSLPRNTSASSLMGTLTRKTATTITDSSAPLENTSAPSPATATPPAKAPPKLALRAATGEDADLAHETLQAELASLDPPPYSLSVPRSVIAGTSLGSYMALAHAFLHPQSVAGLVLMNGGLNPTYPLAFPYLAFTALMSTWSDTGPIRKLYDRGIETYLEKGRTKEEVQGVMEGGSWFRGGGEAVGKGVLGWDYVAMAAALADKTAPSEGSSEQLAERRLRVLLLNADNDALFLLHEQAYIKAFSKPHILLSVARIPDSGHLSFLDNPEFVGKALSSFIRRCAEEEKEGKTIERAWDGDELKDVGGVEGWKRKLASKEKPSVGEKEAGDLLESEEMVAKGEALESVRNATDKALATLKGWLGLGGAAVSAGATASLASSSAGGVDGKAV